MKIVAHQGIPAGELVWPNEHDTSFECARFSYGRTTREMTPSDIRKGGRHRKPRSPRRSIVWPRLFRRAAAATAVTTAFATFSGALSSAAEQPAPPVGYEVQFNLEANDVPMTLHGDELTRDFAGTLTARVTSRDPKDPWKLKFRITNLDVESKDTGDGYGRLTLGNTAGASTPDSTLHVTGQNPPQWEATVHLGFTMKVEKPHHAPTDVGLTTMEPGHLTGMGSGFPPNGEPFTLHSPIKLAGPDSDHVDAEFSKFPLRLSG